MLSFGILSWVTGLCNCLSEDGRAPQTPPLSIGRGDFNFFLHKSNETWMTASRHLTYQVLFHPVSGIIDVHCLWNSDAS